MARFAERNPFFKSFVPFKPDRLTLWDKKEDESSVALSEVRPLISELTTLRIYSDGFFDEFFGMGLTERFENIVNLEMGHLSSKKFAVNFSKSFPNLSILSIDNSAIQIEGNFPISLRELTIVDSPFVIERLSKHESKVKLDKLFIDSPEVSIDVVTGIFSRFDSGLLTISTKKLERKVIEEIARQNNYHRNADGLFVRVRSDSM